jgi:hypothetical protein
MATNREFDNKCAATSSKELPVLRERAFLSNDDPQFVVLFQLENGTDFCASTGALFGGQTSRCHRRDSVFARFWREKELHTVLDEEARVVTVVNRVAHGFCGAETTGRAAGIELPRAGWPVISRRNRSC